MMHRSEEKGNCNRIILLEPNTFDLINKQISDMLTGKRSPFSKCFTLSKIQRKCRAPIMNTASTISKERTISNDQNRKGEEKSLFSKGASGNTQN